MEAEPFETFLDRVTSVRRHTHESQKAPHKPLVLMYALARAAVGERLISFDATEQTLGPILGAHWNANPRVEEPFVRLVNDGFWRLSVAETDLITPGGGISRRKLHDMNVAAGFDDQTFELLAAKPQRITWTARIIMVEIGSTKTQSAIADALRLPI